MSLPILYSFRRCPYAMRARLAILAGGARVELREIVLRDKPAAMLAASPKGTVPVLVLPDGTVIDESLDIMRWAFADNDAGAPDLALIAANDGAFKHHLDRYKYADRHGGDPTEHRDAATRLLDPIETRLTGNRYLGGGCATITDLAIMPFVRQFAATDRRYFDALPLPALHTWLAAHLASDALAAAMLRLPPWRPGDAPVRFPGDGALDMVSPASG